MIGNLQNTQHVFRRIDHAFELVPRVFGLRELDELDLVELVLANEAARVAPRAASFCTEACRVARVALGQFPAVEDFVAVIVRRRHFRRRHEVVVEAFEFEHVLGELRQLSRADHARLVRDVGREHFRVAVLRRVQIHHEVDAGAFEPRTESLVEGEACARDLRRTLGVEDVEISAEIPVRLRLEGELSRFAPAAHFRVLRVVLADGHVVLRHVRDVQEDGVQLVFHLARPSVEIGDLPADLAHFGGDRRDVLALLLLRADLLRHAVAPRLEFFRLLQERAALLLKLLEAAQFQRVTALFEHRLHLVDMIPDKFDVQHVESSHWQKISATNRFIFVL